MMKLELRQFVNQFFIQRDFMTCMICSKVPDIYCIVEDCKFMDFAIVVEAPYVFYMTKSEVDPNLRGGFNLVQIFGAKRDSIQILPIFLGAYEL